MLKYLTLCLIQFQIKKIQFEILIFYYAVKTHLFKLDYL